MRKVLEAKNLLAATSNVPPELSREEREYYGLTQRRYHEPKDVVEGGLPGQRQVIETEEEDPVFKKAIAKLEKKLAEKAAAAAANLVGESSPKKTASGPGPSSASTLPLRTGQSTADTPAMAWGAKQGSASGPASTIYAKKRPRRSTTSASSGDDSEATRPKPSFRNSAQGSSGSVNIPNPSKKACKGKKKILPPYRPEVKYSLALARAGACMARMDLPAEKRVGDNGKYNSNDDKENLRDESEAEPNVSVEKIDDDQEAEREEPPTPNTSAQEDDVLNINIDENDKLDFEPEGEEVDEKILDDTKVNLFNNCYDLRKIFRMRTRTSDPPAKPSEKSMPGIMESMMIIRYFYIHIQLFMQQFFLYLFILILC